MNKFRFTETACYINSDNYLQILQIPLSEIMLIVKKILYLNYVDSFRMKYLVTWKTKDQTLSLILIISFNRLFK